MERQKGQKIPLSDFSGDIKSTGDIILIDPLDNEIGVGEKLAVHTQGLLHRAFSVCILRYLGTENSSAEMLLQKRHPGKYHSGGLWTNTCCGHPLPGELTKDAAERRLFEEMGIRVPLKEVGTFTYKEALKSNLIEHELDHVFIGTVDANDPLTITPHPEEVTEYKWMNLIDLDADIKANKDRYTVWLPGVLKILRTSL